VLTTAIVLETRRGAWDQALALAFVLLGITFALNALTLRLQQRLR
jgi:tungstate transport system permease protein